MTSNQPSKQDHIGDHFEEHLRRFRPVPPRRLEIPSRSRAPWTALAAAAGVLLAAGILLVPRHGQGVIVQQSIPQPVTMGRLNAALRDNNDETLNQLLDDASPRILPHSQPGTVLYELGKE